MTAQNVIDRARLALNDEDASGYRWTDATLFVYLNDGVEEALTRRPDLALAEAGTITTFTDVTALSDTVGLEDDLTAAVADYVVYRALGEDSSDTANAERATWHRDQFTRALYGSA